jgi:type III secretory pathway component EscT
LLSAAYRLAFAAAARNLVLIKIMGMFPVLVVIAAAISVSIDSSYIMISITGPIISARIHRSITGRIVVRSHTAGGVISCGRVIIGMVMGDTAA